MIREVAHTQNAAFERAQALADRHNVQLWVLNRFVTARGKSEYLITSERAQRGWAFSGVVVSRARLGLPKEGGQESGTHG